VTELITRHRSRRADDPRCGPAKKLFVAQKDVTLTGWAVESGSMPKTRSSNFLPSIGRLVNIARRSKPHRRHHRSQRYRRAGRWGDSIYYDPMIAKLVTHAPSRAAAIEAQATALDSFYIDGIRHNIAFLSA